ncbi:MAG: GMC family oxidoreductase [Polyangiaceae bacterium]|nr:GMC family oxidoreductase [Polyangiaceae bacterium]
MSGAIVQLGDVRDQAQVEDAADVVIIGTGAAGATAARVLTEAGLDVVLIEEGAHVGPEQLRSDMWSSFKHVWRDLGFQVASGRAITPILQGRCVGGTTAINGAIIHRMPEKIWARWRDDFGLGAALPYAELERIWQILDRELFVGPAPESVLGKNNSLMRTATERLGIAGNLIQRNVKDCEGSAHCNQGCPTGRRQSMNVSYVPRAVAAGARVYATCLASSLVTRHGRATGVVGRFRDPLTGVRGPKLVVHARRAVLLAASAIQTPLFLTKNRIGVGSGVLGKRLQAHPGTAVVGVFDAPVEMYRGATQGYESVHYWDERMKFETVAMPPELAMARLPGLGPELMRELASYAHLAVWGVQVRAEAQGSVRAGVFGGTQIEYDMTDADIRVLKLGVRRLTEMMFAAGARQVLPGVHGLPPAISSVDELAPMFDAPDDPRLFHTIAAHLFGTALMGGSAFNSVVKPSFETHDLPGLHVVDSSVFPTNMGVNPQHSICALAWLAAERLV